MIDLSVIVLIAVFCLSRRWWYINLHFFHSKNFKPKTDSNGKLWELAMDFSLGNWNSSRGVIYKQSRTGDAFHRPRQYQSKKFNGLCTFIAVSMHLPFTNYTIINSITIKLLRQVSTFLIWLMRSIYQQRYFKQKKSIMSVLLYK